MGSLIKEVNTVSNYRKELKIKSNFEINLHSKFGRALVTKKKLGYLIFIGDFHVL